MALFGFLSGKSRQDRFAESVMTRLTQMGWPHPMEYDPARFTLALGGEAGSISLGAIFQDWSSYPRSQQAAALDQAIAFVFDLGPPPPFEEAMDQLIPVLRSRNVTEAMLCEGGDEPDEMLADAWRPFGDHLAILVAVDRPSSLMIADAKVLKGWGRSFNEVFEIAMRNLRAREAPVFERQEGGFYMAASQDRNDIARLLIPEDFASVGVHGRPIAIAAARDRLLVVGEDEPKAVEAMAEFAPMMLDHHSRPISYAPMILQDGQWRAYQPPPELYAARALYPLQQAHDYEQQLPLILGRLHRAGRPEEVAQFSLIPTDDGVRSLALWIAPSCLLPRADLVVLRTGKTATLVRAWADVEAACGLQPEPRTASPYYVATGWPDATAMEKIAAAPEPAWAKGKGIGVANGRLTMFG